MDQQVGSGSLCFAKAPFIIGTASVVGTKEGEGPLADAFDCIGPDDKFGQQTWEAAESSLQKEALTLALGKADQKPEDMRYLLSGYYLLGYKTSHLAKELGCGESTVRMRLTRARRYAKELMQQKEGVSP